MAGPISPLREPSPFTEKHDILNEIQQFYQNLYSSQNIPDNSIYKYLEKF